jgi:hypothetical protein
VRAVRQNDKPRDVTDRLPDSRSERLVYRHSLLVRITHWVGAVSLVLLLMSGLQILNAHPSLYWGNASNFAHPVASIDIVVRHGNLAGVTNVLGYRFVTTGVLGLSGPPGARLERAFPSWATLPTRVNAPPPEGGGFRLRLKAGSVHLAADLGVTAFTTSRPRSNHCPTSWAVARHARQFDVPQTRGDGASTPTPCRTPCRLKAWGFLIPYRGL